MSIRMKLLLSYAAMLVIPLVSIMLISLLMVIVFRGDLGNVKGMYESTEDLFDYGNVEHVAKEIKRSVERQPELLKDHTYLDEMTTELQRLDSGLIITLNGAVDYRSLEFRQHPELIERLPTYMRNDFMSHHPAIKIGNTDYVFIQFDFKDQSIGQATAYIVTKVNPATYFIRKYFPSLFVALLLILIVTHVLLTTYMSRKIIRPLLMLRNAAHEIKEGNLDFQVEVAGKDEIGQLGIVFEEMRSRLQHSIQVQLQYEENRKELIASISHDLRTPLTAIKGYVDGIMDGIADTPEKHSKYMRTIAVKADELDHLINELFLYSKLDLNRQPFYFETVTLVPFLQDWSEELQFELEKRGIRFQAELQLEPTFTVSLDRDHFKRVLNNIIENCVRYMNKQEPEIRLSAFREGDKAVLQMTDNGAGIEPLALPYIFERFFRADESRNAHTGGSGLGLAIAKQIMEGHRGAIAASSQLSIGTTITLHLPLTKGKLTHEGGGYS